MKIKPHAYWAYTQGISSAARRSMRPRFHAIFITILLVTQATNAYASDWSQDEFATQGAIAPNVANQSARSLAPLPPFANQMQLDQAAKSDGIKLHFAQAIDALDLEIFAKKNERADITERLDLLEKAVFGSSYLADASNNMIRLTRLLNAVTLSLSSVESAAHITSPLLPKRSNQSFDSNQRGILSSVLHSPTFWMLVGVTGAVVGAYLLSRNGYASPTEPTQASRYINPDQYYSSGYMRNGRWVDGGMKTRANGITSDNLSGR